MPKQMIADLRPGEPVETTFLLAESALRTTRNDKTYLTATLTDRTGRIEGRLWDATEALAGSLAVDDFVFVKGRAESYRNELQVNIRSITRADTDSLRLGDFLPQCPRDPQEMLAELKQILEPVQDKDYRALLDAFLADEALMRGFVSAPAAVKNHHAYLGGLLEHTLCMAGLAEKVLAQYASLRPNLLLTGVFLHDIGKVRELACKRSFRFTTPGNLVGHIVLGVLIHPRTWCSFCPMGTMQNAIGGGKRQLRIDSDSCVECRQCEQACPFDLPIVKHKNSGRVSERDCLRCSECVAVSPKKALTWPPQE